MGEDAAGEAFADGDAEAVDEVGIEPLVGAEDELLGGRVVEEDGTDRGAHVPGDGGDDAAEERVEALGGIEEACQFRDVAHEGDIVFLGVAHGGVGKGIIRGNLTAGKKKVSFRRVCPMV